VVSDLSVLGGFLLIVLSQSCHNSTVGSIRIARTIGMHDAAMATTISTTATPANVAESVALTLHKELSRNRDAENASARPEQTTASPPPMTSRDDVG
jgi:hypothetical protein